jgi:hypothetical protein
MAALHSPAALAPSPPKMSLLAYLAGSVLIICMYAYGCKHILRVSVYAFFAGSVLISRVCIHMHVYVSMDAHFSGQVLMTLCMYVYMFKMHVVCLYMYVHMEMFDFVCIHNIYIHMYVNANTHTFLAAEPGALSPKISLFACL